MDPSFDFALLDNKANNIKQPVKDSYDSVTVTFHVRNAIDNMPLPDVEIDLPLIPPISTDNNGQASFILNEVPYNLSLTATKSGFEIERRTVRVENTEPVQRVNIFLSPSLDPDQNYRLVMSWGPEPQDLDLHVIEFDSTTYVCETFYADKNGCKNISLNQDVRTGGNNGAETITWANRQPLTYLMFVYRYYGSPQLVDSQVVTLFLQISYSIICMGVLDL